MSNPNKTKKNLLQVIADATKEKLTTVTSETRLGGQSEVMALEGDGRAATDNGDAIDDKGIVEDGQKVAILRPIPKDNQVKDPEVIQSDISGTASDVDNPSETPGLSEWPIDRTNVDVVRERQSTFVVFIDKELRLRWLSAVSPSELSEESQSAIARARLVAATPTSYFEEGQQRAWMRMIGESLALALSGDVNNSHRALSRAEDFVAARARDMARIWYVKASFLALALLVSFGLFVSFFTQNGSFSSAIPWFDDSIGLAILFGSVGSQFSILLRLSTLSVDPGAGRDAHYIEAIIRILLGAFAAVIAVIAVQADIVLAFIETSGDQRNTWFLPALALVAGASERFVPGILRKAETSSLGEGTEVVGEHVGDGQAAQPKSKEPPVAQS